MPATLEGEYFTLVTQKNHCNVCPFLRPLHERAHVLQRPLSESDKHLMLVADESQPILDAGARLLAKEMFYFDISIFNGGIVEITERCGP
jgi:hypothetical protein